MRRRFETRVWEEGLPWLLGWITTPLVCVIADAGATPQAGDAALAPLSDQRPFAKAAGAQPAEMPVQGTAKFSVVRCSRLLWVPGLLCTRGAQVSAPHLFNYVVSAWKLILSQPSMLLIRRPAAEARLGHLLPLL